MLRARQGRPQAMMHLSAVLCSLLLCAVPADAAWSFIFTNAPTDAIVQGMVLKTGFVTLDQDPSPQEVYVIKTSGGCGAAATKVHSIPSPDTAKQHLLSITLDFTIGESYTWCYTLDGSSHAAMGTTFSVAGTSPFSFSTGADAWRAGAQAPSLVLTASDSLFSSEGFPKLLKCDPAANGGVNGGCGSSFSGATLCATEDGAFASSTWALTDATKFPASLAFSMPLPLLSQGSYRVCWLRRGNLVDAWSELPEALTVAGPNPAFFYVHPFPDATSARVRDALTIHVAADLAAQGKKVQSLTLVSATSGSCASDGTTYEVVSSEIAQVDKAAAGNVPAAAVDVVSTTMRVLDASVARVVVCATLVDVGDATGATATTSRVPLFAGTDGLALQAAEPAACVAAPATPRAGQVVTVSLTRVADGLSGTAQDTLWFEASGAVCDKTLLVNSSVADVLETTVGGSEEWASVRVRFKAATTAVLCFQKAGSQASVVAKVCEVTTTDPVPSAYTLSPQRPVVRAWVTLAYENLVDDTQLLLKSDDAAAVLDEIKFVGVTETCDAATAASSSALVEVATAASVRVAFTEAGCFRSCYKLRGATWADVVPAEADVPRALLEEKCGADAAPNTVYIWPSAPTDYAILTAVTPSVLMHDSTFRLSFNVPADPVVVPSASDAYRVVAFAGAESDLTEPVLSQLCQTAAVAVEGPATDLMASGTEATLRLSKGQYVACYTLADYTPVPLRNNATMTYLLSIGDNPYTLAAVTPSSLRARQMFTLDLNMASGEDSLRVYGTGSQYPWCLDKDTPLCRCPDPVERASVLAPAVRLATPDTRYRVRSLAQGHYLVCHEQTALLTVLPVAAAVPSNFTTDVTPRKGRPFKVFFSNGGEQLLESVRVDMRKGKACECHVSPGTECAVVSQFLTAPVPDGRRVITVDVEMDRGDYTVCYYNGNDERSQTLVHTGEDEAVKYLSVAQADPSEAVFAPPQANQKLVLKITMVAAFSDKDVLRAIPAASSCLTDAMDDVGSSPVAAYHGWTAEKQFLITFLKEGDFKLCYKREGEAIFVGIPEPATFTVLQSSPHTLATTPNQTTQPSVGMSLDVSFNCSKAGTLICSKQDLLLVVESQLDCDTVKTTLATNGVQWEIDTASTNTTLAYLTNSPADVYFNRVNPLKIVDDIGTFTIVEQMKAGTYSVCHQVADAFFTTVGTITIHTRNPSVFAFDPVAPTEGEYDVRVNFTGTNLAAGDNFFFTHHEVPCRAFDGETPPGTVGGGDNKKVFVVGADAPALTTWQLLLPCAHTAYNPTVPASHAAVAAGQTGYNLKVCYRRSGARWAQVGAPFAPFGPAPTTLAVTPSGSLFGFTRVRAMTTLRLAFSAVALTLSAADDIKIISFSGDEVCSEAEPAAPAVEMHFPLLEQLVPTCAGCPVTLPVTFLKEGQQYYVCYRVAGRQYMTLGTRDQDGVYTPTRLLVDPAVPSGFTHYTTTWADVPAAVAAGTLVQGGATGAEAVAARGAIAAGDELLLGMVPESALAADDIGYLVGRGEPCLYTPEPTNPARKGPTLPLATHVFDGSKYYLQLARAARGSFDLCVYSATDLERSVAGGVDVGPESPAHFRLTDVAVAAGAARIVTPSENNTALQFSLVPSSLGSVLPLSAAADVALVTDAAACTGAELWAADAYVSTPLELKAGADGGVVATWTVDAASPRDAREAEVFGNVTRPTASGAAAAQHLRLRLCYLRGGKGSFTEVREELVPFFHVSFDDAVDGPTAFNTLARGYVLHAHVAMAGLQKYALAEAEFALTASITDRLGVPPNAPRTFTLWVSPSLPDAGTAANLLHIPGVLALAAINNGLALFAAPTAGGEAFVRVAPAAAPAAAAFPAERVGEWFFVQVSVDSEAPRVTVRVDGAEYADFTAGFVLPKVGLTAEAPLVLEYFGTPAVYPATAGTLVTFNGRVDDVRVYAHALTPVQLTALRYYATNLNQKEDPTDLSVSRGPAHASGTPAGSIAVFQVPDSFEAAPLLHRGKGTLTFRVGVATGRVEEQLSAGDAAFLVAADDGCEEVGGTTRLDAQFVSTTGAAAVFAVPQVLTTEPLKACYKHYYSTRVVDFGTSIPVAPSSPAGVTYVHTVLREGQQVPFTIVEADTDAPLVPSLDTLMVTRTGDAACAAPVYTVSADHNLRAPDLAASAGATATYSLCYRRGSPAGHPLTGLWVAVPNSAFTVGRGRHTAYAVAPAWGVAVEGAADGDLVLQKGYAGQVVTLEFPAGTPEATVQDSVFAMKVSSDQLTSRSVAGDPCVFLAPYSSAAETFAPLGAGAVGRAPFNAGLVDGLRVAAYSAFSGAAGGAAAGPFVTYAFPSIPAAASEAALSAAYLCYQTNTREDLLDTPVWGSLQQRVHLVAPDPLSYTVVPASPVAEQGSQLTLVFERLGAQAQGTEQRVRVLEASQSCEDGGVVPHFDAAVDTAAPTFALALASAGEYRVCYAETHGSVALTRAFEETFTVQKATPETWVSQPLFPVGESDVRVTFAGLASEGLNLMGTARLVLFTPTATCQDTGLTAASLTDASGAATPPLTAVSALFPAVAKGTYLVCFKLEKLTLFTKVPGGDLAVGRNPWSYKVTAGIRMPGDAAGVWTVKSYPSTQGALEFSGTGFTVQDTVLLIPPSVQCEAAGSAGALTVTVATLPTGQVARAIVPLQTPLPFLTYTVCYRRAVGGVSSVAPLLTVQATGVVEERRWPQPSPRAGEVVTLVVSRLLVTQTAFYVADPALIGKLTEADKVPLTHVRSTGRTEVDGRFYVTFELAFPKAGSFHLYIDHGAVVNKITETPELFVVEEAVPTGFAPTAVLRGQEVTFVTRDQPPAERAQHELRLSTDPLCLDEAQACIAPRCVGAGTAGRRAFFGVNPVRIFAATGSSLFLCYKRQGGGWMRLAGEVAVGDGVVQAAPTCPASNPPLRNVYYNHLLGVSVAWDPSYTPKTGPNAYRLHLTWAVSCAALSGRDYTQALAADGTASLPLVPPAGTAAGASRVYYICIEDVEAGTFYGTEAGTIVVSDSAGTAATRPSPLRRLQIGGKIDVDLTQRSEALVHVALFAGTSRSLCAEACGAVPPPRGLRANSVLGDRVTWSTVSNHTATVHLTAVEPAQVPLAASGDYVLCYSSVETSGALTYLAVVNVAAPNPSSVTVPAVMRGGDLVTATFEGEGLDYPQSDAAFVPLALQCGASSPSVLPVNLTISRKSFYMQTIHSLATRGYRACYRDRHGWSEVPGQLEVRPSSPEVVTVAPPDVALREGIALSLTASGPDLSGLDNLLVVAAGPTSCGWNPIPACPRCNVAGPSVAALRLSAGTYEYCYKIADARAHTKVYNRTATAPPPDTDTLVAPLQLVVAPANPRTFAALPPAPEVGQHMSLTLHGTGLGSRPDNRVKLVRLLRGGAVPDGVCDYPAANTVQEWSSGDGATPDGPDKLVLQGSVPTRYQSMPPAAAGDTLLFYAVVCFRFAGTREAWVSVPPLLTTAEADGVAVHTANPAGASLSPLPARFNVLNLKLRLETPGTTPAVGDRTSLLKEGRACATAGPADTLFTSEYDGSNWALATDAVSVPVGAIQDPSTQPQQAVLCYHDAASKLVQQVAADLKIWPAQPSVWRNQTWPLRVGVKYTDLFVGGPGATDSVHFAQVDDRRLSLEEYCLERPEPRIPVSVAPLGTAATHYFRQEGSYVACYFTEAGAASIVPNEALGRSVFGVLAGNPSALLTVPSVLYAGQTAHAVFVGVGLSAADSVRLVSGGDCWGGGVSQDAVLALVTESTPVVSGLFDPLNPRTFLIYQQPDGATVAEAYTVCYSRATTGPPAWTAVGGANGLAFLPANPGAFFSFPATARVGQKVTLTLTAGAAGTLTASDRVKVVEEGQDCEASAPAFDVRESAVSGVTQAKVEWRVLNDDDDYVAAFANFTGTVCYKMAVHGSDWIPVGASDATSTLVVAEAHPASYVTAPLAPLVGDPFTVSFVSPLPFGTGGEAKLVPEAASCDAAAVKTLVATPGESNAFEPLHFQETPDAFSVTVCYKLPAATYAALPVPLSVGQQAIRCADVTSVLTQEKVRGTTRVMRGQTLRVDLTPADPASPPVVNTVKLVAWGAAGCDAPAHAAVSRDAARPLGWTAYVQHAAPGSLRLCWRAEATGRWAAACTSCESAEAAGVDRYAPAFCPLHVEAAYPTLAATAPAPVFTTQAFAATFGGGYAPVLGDTVELHATDTPQADDFACEGTPQAAKTVGVDDVAEATVGFGSLPKGVYRVCYGRKGLFGDVQLKAVLRVSPFASCSVAPQVPGGAPEAVLTRRLTRVSPAPPAAEDGFATLLYNDSGVVEMGFSAGSACGAGAVPVGTAVFDPAGGVHVDRTFAESAAGTAVFACLKPNNGVWGTLCSLAVASGPTHAPCTAHTAVLAGQHVTVTPPGLGRVALVPRGPCSAVDEAAYVASQPAEAGTGGGFRADVPGFVSEGEYSVCFLAADGGSGGQQVGLEFAAEVCVVSVGQRSPVGAELEHGCAHEGSRDTIVVSFAEAHPQGVVPTAQDRYAIRRTASPHVKDCWVKANATDTFVVKEVINATAVRIPHVSLAQGVWSLCYERSGGGWAFVKMLSISEPNPASVDVQPAMRRAGQMLTMMYSASATGVLDPDTDTVYYAQTEAECLVDGVTPHAHTPRPVTNGTEEATESQHAFPEAGGWFGCYRRGVCPAAPQALTVAPFHPTACDMQKSIRAGTAFTLRVSSTQGPLSGGDSVKLVLDERLCTDAEPPAPGTAEMKATVTSEGVEVDVDFFVTSTVLSDTRYRVCYQLADELYAQIAGTCAVTLRPRNPASYEASPKNVVARRRFSLTFRGDTLLRGDRVALVQADTAPAGCTGLAAGAGTAVAVTNETYAVAEDLLLFAAVPHTVCYYAQDSARWVALLEPLALQLSNPMRYEVVPSVFPSPLAGNLFALHFHKASDDKGTVFADLHPQDIVRLETSHGESHSYLPARFINGGETVAFDVSLSNYTYSVRYLKHQSITHLPREVLYFEDLLVHRNPYGFSLSKKQQARVRQRLTLVMHGKGLIPPVEEANQVPPPGNFDGVRVLRRDAAFRTLDDQCKPLQNGVAAAGEVPTLSPLYAAGDGSSQVDVAFDAEESYVVCYRRKSIDLYQGVPLISDECDAACAMAQQPPLQVFAPVSAPAVLSKAAAISTLEEIGVTVRFDHTPRWGAGDFVLPVSTAEPCGPYSAGAANASAVAPHLGEPTASFSVRLNRTGTFRLCYYSPQVLPNGEWTELLPHLTTTHQSPDGFRLTSGNPRSGGSIVSVALTDKGAAWADPVPPAASRAARLLQMSQQLSVVDGGGGAGCVGAPPLPSWASLVGRDGGIYSFSFANRSSSAVSFCSTPVRCAHGGAECTRYLGSLFLGPAGMTGFIFEAADEVVKVFGEGLSRDDTIFLAKDGVGSCVAGGLQPAERTTYSSTPTSVSRDGTAATFSASVGDQRVQVCYKMADQVTYAPVSNLQAAAGSSNVLVVPFVVPTTAVCTGQVSGYVGEVLVGSWTVTHLNGGEEVAVRPETKAAVAFSKKPAASTPVYNADFNSNFTRYVVSNVAVDAAGLYEVVVTTTHTGGKVYTATCTAFTAAAHPNATAVPSETPAPPTVVVSNDDDCDGNSICTIHIIILVCVVVFGLIIVVVAALLLWKRDDSPPIVQSTVVPRPSETWHGSQTNYGQSAMRTPEFVPTSMLYHDSDGRSYPPPPISAVGGVSAPGAVPRSPASRAAFTPPAALRPRLNPTSPMVFSLEPGEQFAPVPNPLGVEFLKVHTPPEMEMATPSPSKEVSDDWHSHQPRKEKREKKEKRSRRRRDDSAVSGGESAADASADDRGSRRRSSSGRRSRRSGRRRRDNEESESESGRSRSSDGRRRRRRRGDSSGSKAAGDRGHSSGASSGRGSGRKDSSGKVVKASPAPLSRAATIPGALDHKKHENAVVGSPTAIPTPSKKCPHGVDADDCDRCMLQPHDE